MPFERIVPGQLVRSTAGRDLDQVYLVVGFTPPALALLADGRSRKVARPKKKNVRHISVLRSIDEVVAAKLAGGMTVTDEEIRRAVGACISAGEKRDADEEGDSCPSRT